MRRMVIPTVTSMMVRINHHHLRRITHGLLGSTFVPLAWSSRGEAHAWSSPSGDTSPLDGFANAAIEKRLFGGLQNLHDFQSIFAVAAGASVVHDTVGEVGALKLQRLVRRNSRDRDVAI